MNWLKTILSRQAVQFYHLTDLNNLLSIMKQGINPSSGQLGFDENMRPVMTYYGTYFGRDESSVSTGAETEIERKMLLQGWLPTEFLEEHGESDADYIYRNDNWYSSNFYPNAPQNDPEEDEEEEYYGGIPDNIVDEDYTWDKSYWQEPYGAAAVKTSIPFSWIQNIRVGDRWLGRDEAVKILEPELNRQQDQYRKKLRIRWALPHNAPTEMFYAKSWDKVQKLYTEFLDIKDELSPDAVELVEEVYAIIARNHKQKNQEHANV